MARVTDGIAITERYLSLLRRALMALPPYHIRMDDADVSGRVWCGKARMPNALTMVGDLRLQNVEQCLRSVVADGVPGDFLEAGCWRGGVGIYALAVLEALESDKTVWLCDGGKQGFPPPDQCYPQDNGDTLHERWSVACPMENIPHFAALYGYTNHLRCVEGYFADTLPALPVERLAILRLDGDTYGATMTTLRCLYDKVSPGGYIIIDDYAPQYRCSDAVDDFRLDREICEPITRVDWAGAFWRKPSVA